MPSAIEYIPPTDPDRGLFSHAVRQERMNRRDSYRTAIGYYEGTHPAQLTVEDGEPDDNVIVNLVKMAGDRTASFLFPAVPRFEIDPASVEPTDEEKYITDFIEENGGLAKLIKMALRGFLAGHCFVRVKPPAKKGKKPRMIVLDPTAVTVFWRADDVGDILWYEVRYAVGRTMRVQDFVQTENGWMIYTYEAKVQEDRVGIFDIPTSHGEPDHAGLYLDLIDYGDVFKRIERIKHPSEVAPIVDFPHLPHPDDFYGLSEFTQKDLQDTINRVASLLNRIVRENSDPTDVITGADIDEVENEGGILTVASPTAKVQRLEMRSDMGNIRSTLDKLMEVYLAVARVVLLKGEPKDLQRVTNASVRTLFLDALSKNTVLQSSYGFGLRLVARLALEMGYAAGDIAKNPKDLPITIHFAEPLPTDMKEIADINAIMNNLGQSMRTANTKMGNDWAFEQAAKASEQEQAMEQQRQQMELAQEFAPKEDTVNNSPNKAENSLLTK